MTAFAAAACRRNPGEQVPTPLNTQLGAKSPQAPPTITLRATNHSRVQFGYGGRLGQRAAPLICDMSSDFCGSP